MGKLVGLWQGLRGGLSKARGLGIPPLRLRPAPRSRLITARPSRDALNLFLDFFGPVFRSQPRVASAPRFAQARASFAAPFARSVGRWTTHAPHLKPSLSRPNVGLGTARSFSTGMPLNANVISNAPFGIRVLVDSGLFNFEEYKARQAKMAQLPRPAKRQTRESSFSSLPASLPSELYQSSLDEFFPRSSSSEELELPSVRLVFRMPNVAYDEQPYYSEGGPRILPSSADRAHAREMAMLGQQRWQEILSDLRRAFEEDTDFRVVTSGGERHIDCWLPLDHVRQAIGLWQPTAFVELIDLRGIVDEDSEELASDSTGSWSDLDNADYEHAVHSAVASRFIMPDMQASGQDLGAEERL